MYYGEYQYECEQCHGSGDGAYLGRCNRCHGKGYTELSPPRGAAGVGVLPFFVTVFAIFFVLSAWLDKGNNSLGYSSGVAHVDNHTNQQFTLRVDAWYENGQKHPVDWQWNVGPGKYLRLIDGEPIKASRLDYTLLVGQRKRSMKTTSSALRDGKLTIHVIQQDLDGAI